VTDTGLDNALLQRRLVASGRERGRNQRRQAEVENLRVPVIGDHDVRRFEITMHDAGGMRRRQCVGDLYCILNRSAMFRRSLLSFARRSTVAVARETAHRPIVVHARRRAASGRSW
jgi:hypothetical protein